MTWQSVGQHTFLPTDRDVQVGSFDLAPGQDTIWVRITQINQPAEWPWSYGILSWRSSSGLELGSKKAYSTQLGEVFRLGVGLPPSDRTGSIWFEPRGFNLGWLKAGFPWELSFEAQAGSGEVNFNPYWGRVGSTLSPATAGDSVAIDGTLRVRTTDDYATNPSFEITDVGVHKTYRASSDANAGIQVWYSNVGSVFRPRITFFANGSLALGGTDSSNTYNGRWNSNGTLEIGSDVPANGAEITLNANGSAQFSGNITAANVSDVRFKTNIQPASPQLADVVALGNQLKNWDWNDDAPLNDELKARRFLGLVAQEAEKVCPELTYEVRRVEDDSYKAINHDILVMKLLGAVAEQTARIEALEAEVAALNATSYKQ